MHGNVINVPTNVDQTQSILPFLPHDGETLGVFFLKGVLNTNHFICQEMLIQIW
jgi:hypothetical protein